MSATTTQPVSHDQQRPGGPRDLREFIETLFLAGRIVHVERAASPEHEIQQYCRAAAELGNRPSLVFDNIVGYKGKRLALNLLRSWTNCALMCGLPANTPVAELIHELCERADRKGCEPIWIDKAPVYECVQTDNIDLFQLLPLFRINDQDGGFYLHKACIVSEDSHAPFGPDRAKFGMYSLQVQGPDKLGVHLCGTDNLSIHLGTAEKIDRSLPVAICLGVPPLASLVAAAGMGYESREYDLVSALQQSPFELTRCPNSRLSVPAWSEIVLEGFIEPKLRCPEGPFVSDRGRLTPVKNQPQIRITAVAHRRNPILDNMYVGGEWTERDCLAGLRAALRLHRYSKDILTQVARSGTRADGMYLRLDFLNQHPENRSASQSTPTPSVAQPSFTSYKRELEIIRRKQSNASAVRNQDPPVPATQSDS